MAKANPGGMRMTVCFLLLTLAAVGEEIPSSQVAKVSHAEGYTVKTKSHEVSEAVVTLKGVSKPKFLLVVDGKRYFTIIHPKGWISEGAGPDVRYVVDQKANTLTIYQGKAKVVEKFSQDVIDS